MSRRTGMSGSFGSAPSVADRNWFITEFQLDQTRLQDALNALVGPQAASARAANPGHYASLVAQFDNLLGPAGEALQAEIGTLRSTEELQAAFRSYHDRSRFLRDQAGRLLDVGYANPYTWLYYGLGAVGVLALGIFFLNRKKRARR